MTQVLCGKTPKRNDKYMENMRKALPETPGADEIRRQLEREPSRTMLRP
ncbi:MAG TPA: hypothetical protein VLV87_03550 [Gammaproteobacteria bacterium]|nr:hypothetical protein [Gammaproteobacteria bacterium]